jgi:hypothetical protein
VTITQAGRTDEGRAAPTRRHAPGAGGRAVVKRPSRPARQNGHVRFGPGVRGGCGHEVGVVMCPRHLPRRPGAAEASRMRSRKRATGGGIQLNQRCLQSRQAGTPPRLQLSHRASRLGVGVQDGCMGSAFMDAAIHARQEGTPTRRHRSQSTGLAATTACGVAASERVSAGGRALIWISSRIAAAGLGWNLRSTSRCSPRRYRVTRRPGLGERGRAI